MAIEAHALAGGNLFNPLTFPGKGRNCMNGLGIQADFDGMTVPADVLLGDAEGAPPQTRIISCARSKPVSISVTGCST